MRSVPRLVLCYISLLSSWSSTLTHAEQLYQKQFVGWSGLIGAVQVGPDISIANNGRVAYVLRFKDQNDLDVDHIIVADPSAGIIDMTPSYTSANQQTLMPGIQINDLGDVLIRRRRVFNTPAGPLVRTDLQRHSFTDQSITTLATGEPLFGQFDGIHPLFSINNDRDVVFATLNQGQNGLATISSFGSLVVGLGALSLPQPVISDDERLVIRRHLNPSDSSIRVYPANFSSVAILASVGSQFLVLGQSPGISDNGRVVAFCAMHGSGSSVLACLRKNDGSWTAPIPIAGSGDGTWSPGESWDDSNCNHILEPGEDSGGVTGVNFASRVSVAVDASQLTTICFLGFDESSSKTVFTVRAWADLEAGTMRVIDVSKVATVGEVLNFQQQAHVITDLGVADSVNSKGEVAFWAAAEATQFVIRAIPQRKPVLIIPGIFGTQATPGIDSWAYWTLIRGVSEEYLRIDPLASTYDDMLMTLESHGYSLAGPTQNLYVVNYDWRLEPGPEDGVIDGEINGLAGPGSDGDALANGPTRYAVHYLGRALAKAAQDWAQRYQGAQLPAVDIICHSTGGLVARAYIQSDAYNGVFTGATGPLRLPRIDKLIMLGVPNRGAPKAWNPLNNNWISEAAYWFHLSKVAYHSYLKQTNGYSITGPFYNISGITDETEFLRLWCPTLRSLVATYPFLLPIGGTLQDINSSALRNGLLLNQHS